MDAEDDWRRIEESNNTNNNNNNNNVMAPSKGLLMSYSKKITEFSFDDAQVAYAFRLVGLLLASTELNGDMMMMMHRRVTSQVLQRVITHEQQGN
jgi:hypothetical protein